ncbi:hypothetical protein DPMN_141413 [Dreissena polymorpha]|uniref:Uncharacterized protein n=1 Tax=Dreissena polymorpha TaxID=45954 RepID=A0A9D4GDE5_DREPO|nr:hypothetical protein DPMN_141413 [Dreissena polymorpha]
MINGLRAGSSNTNLPGTTGFASNMAKRDPEKLLNKNSKDEAFGKEKNALKTEIEIAQEVGKVGNAGLSLAPVPGKVNDPSQGQSERCTKENIIQWEPRSIPVCYRRSTDENRDESYKLFNAFTLFPVPPRLKPVNSPAESRSTPDWLRFIPVKPRQSPGCRRDYAGIHRGVAVAKTRSALAPVELRCHPVCFRCHAGRSRSLPETPGSPRSANDKKEFS